MEKLDLQVDIILQMNILIIRIRMGSGRTVEYVLREMPCKRQLFCREKDDLLISLVYENGTPVANPMTAFVTVSSQL